MKIEEAKKEVNNLYFCGKHPSVIKEKVNCIIDQLDQPKPVVPQVAIDYYEQYKDLLSSFDEWFSDFYENEFEAEFEKAEELQRWLYDNDNKINLQHELALATLIVNGPDAVEVEKEKLYVINLGHEVGLNIYLKRTDKNIYPNRNEWSTTGDIRFASKFTEQEIRKDFDWAWRWKKEV